MSISHKLRKTLPNGRNSSGFKKQKIDGPFVAITLEMLASPAWQALGITERRVLDRIELEHLSHGGTQNGNLIVTYDDFVQYGVSRKGISKALHVLEELGFLEVKVRGRGANGEARIASRYRLTAVTGNLEPTNEWRQIKTKEEAKNSIRLAVQRSEATGSRYRRK
ncbi:hypothetical protein [Roseibium sp.]|uniref:hypothetical protein n=1 Tax=Roseibium sp. TaxID=1936156 RepID=UPI003B51571B